MAKETENKLPTARTITPSTFTFYESFEYLQEIITSRNGITHPMTFSLGASANPIYHSSTINSINRTTMPNNRQRENERLPITNFVQRSRIYGTLSSSLSKEQSPPFSPVTNRRTSLMQLSADPKNRHFSRSDREQRAYLGTFYAGTTKRADGAEEGGGV